MKISSPFVDYYDYLSHVYGVDENIYFLRRNLTNYHTHNEWMHWDDKPFIHDVSQVDVRTNIDYYGLSVLGHFYQVKVDRSKPITKYTLLTNVIKQKWRDVIVYQPGIKYPFLDKIAKEIEQPIFFFKINRYGSGSGYVLFEIDAEIPNLSLMNFVDQKSAEQIYQDISYYIANIIKDGIDIRPPTEVANKDKIVQAGFDLKTSFRHRTADKKSA